jgi:hypothetical protein
MSRPNLLDIPLLVAYCMICYYIIFRNDSYYQNKIGVPRKPSSIFCLTILSEYNVKESLNIQKIYGVLKVKLKNRQTDNKKEKNFVVKVKVIKILLFFFHMTNEADN